MQVFINIVSWFFFISPCTLLSLPMADDSLPPWSRASCVEENLAEDPTSH